MNSPLCPCGSDKTYSACCERYILGNVAPPTPEALMRSRYSAFTFSNIDYISQTMSGLALKNFNADNARLWVKKIKWLGLKEVKSSDAEENYGKVEFIVEYILDGRKQTLHEISEFHRENDRWYYVDGTPGDNINALETSDKVGRNDVCPCGSGKKFKKCCGN